MYNTGYQPSRYFAKERIAPTEYDAMLRSQLVHGYVHDETAAMLGGVSGNAGLLPLPPTWPNFVRCGLTAVSMAMHRCCRPKP